MRKTIVAICVERVVAVKTVTVTVTGIAFPRALHREDG